MHKIMFRLKETSFSNIQILLSRLANSYYGGATYADIAFPATVSCRENELRLTVEIDMPGVGECVVAQDVSQTCHHMPFIRQIVECV